MQTLRESLKHGFHPHESPHGPAIKRQVRCKRARACELTAWSSFQFQLIFFGFVETFQRPAPPSVRRRRALWARCHHVLQHLVRDASTVNKGTRNSTLVFPLNPTPSTHGIRRYHSQLNGFPRPHPIDRGRRFQGLNAEKPTTTTPPHVGARVPAWRVGRPVANGANSTLTYERSARFTFEYVVDPGGRRNQALSGLRRRDLRCRVPLSPMITALTWSDGLLVPQSHA